MTISCIQILCYVPKIVEWSLVLVNGGETMMLFCMATNALLIFNSCSNPFIYAFRTTSFQKKFKQALRWLKDRFMRRNDAESRDGFERF